MILPMVHDSTHGSQSYPWSMVLFMVLYLGPDSSVGLDFTLNFNSTLDLLLSWSLIRLLIPDSTAVPDLTLVLDSKPDL